MKRLAGWVKSALERAKDADAPIYIRVFARLPIFPVHMGSHIRTLHFWKALRDLPLDTFSIVLDAGCGQGDLTMAVARHYPWLTVDGIDIDGDRLPQFFPGNCSFKAMDLLEFPNHEPVYDLIYSIDVLEHIPGNIRVIENLSAHLKPGGYLFLHMPSNQEPKHMLPACVFKSFYAWREQEHVGEHYSREELTMTVERMGFLVEKSYCTFDRFGQLAWELDRATDRWVMARLIVAPLLRCLAAVSVRRTTSNGGSILLLARKMPQA